MAMLDELLDDIVHVEDDAIAEAITLLLERSKLVVEGAGAASVAALLHGAADGQNACALLSGGNIDATLLVSVVRHGLTRAGRYLVLRTRVPDRPGGLVKLLELVAAERGNIVEVNHRREGFGLDVAETGVELTIITRNDEHCRALLAALEQHGYRDRVGQPPQRLNDTTSPSNVATPPGETARASKPSRASSDAAIAARGPRLAHGDDRLRAVERAAADLAQQPIRDVARARDVAAVALERFAHVDHLHVGGSVEELLQLDHVDRRKRLLGARLEDVAPRARAGRPSTASGPRPSPRPRARVDDERAHLARRRSPPSSRTTRR